LQPRPVPKATVVFDDNNFENIPEDGVQTLVFAKKSEPHHSAVDRDDEAVKNKDLDSISDQDGDDEEEEEDDDVVGDGEATPSNKNGHILIHLKYSILTPRFKCKFFSFLTHIQVFTILVFKTSIHKYSQVFTSIHKYSQVFTIIQNYKEIVPPHQSL
jgi:hypothetical protein